MCAATAARPEAAAAGFGAGAGLAAGAGAGAGAGSAAGSAFNVKAAPHLEQNLLLSGFFSPHCGQYISDFLFRDFYIEYS